MEEENRRPLRVMAPTAGLIPARERASYIMKLANSIHAEVYAVHIIEDRHVAPPNAIDDGKEALATFKTEGRKADVPVTTFLEEGKIVPTLISFAHKHDVHMIVMGTSEDNIIAEWIVSDFKAKTEIPVTIIPAGLEDIM